MPRCASARASSAPSPPRRGRSTSPTRRPTRPSATCRRPAKRSTSSFLGVPILRAGRTLGVLVVQNKAHRTYYDEEVEALQTIAMVLAEMIAVGELEGLAPAGHLARPQAADHASTGVGLCEGVGLGHVVLHEPRVVVTTLIGEDAEQESARLDAAIASLRLSVDDMLSRDDIGDERRAPRRARGLPHVRPRPRLGAADARGDPQRPHRRGGGREGAERHARADAAPDRPVPARPAARFRRPRQPAAARADGQAARAVSASDLPRDAIIVARTMGAAELLDYDRERIRGLVLEEGGPTSHVAIVARALGIATVGRVGQRRVAGRERRRDHRRRHRRRSASAAAAPTSRRPMPRRCASGRGGRSSTGCSATSRRSPATASASTLLMNAGLLVDLPHLDESGAEGIGLFRTELQFMIAATHAEAQRAEGALRAPCSMRPASRPVTFRTLDIGGDKVLPYHAHGAGGKPGDGLAGDPPRPRPAGAAAHADPRAAPGRGRPRAAHHAADGHRARRVPADAGADRPRTRASAPPRPRGAGAAPASAPWSRCRRSSSSSTGWSRSPTSSRSARTTSSSS